MIQRISLSRSDQRQQVLERETTRLQGLLGLDRRGFFEVNLILDELSANIFDHNGDREDLHLEIVIGCDGKKLHMLFIDNGSPFNPASMPSPDTSLPLEQRRPGGLGLLLVKKLSCAISYERRDGKNRTSVEKTLFGAKHDS